MIASRLCNSFTSAPTRRQLVAAAAAVLGAAALAPRSALAQAQEEISHSAPAIHQEPVIPATRKRVYEVLTTAKQFDDMTKLIADMAGAIDLVKHPTTINPVAGGAFSMFGGIITGRNIELVPDRRVVQAWRVSNWDPGVFSIVRFQLEDQGAGSTKIIFDHTGFPNSDTEHLAPGWKAHYWEPIAKYLAG
jgi:activator of HSP90 ATPase